MLWAQLNVFFILTFPVFILPGLFLSSFACSLHCWFFRLFIQLRFVDSFLQAWTSSWDAKINQTFALRLQGRGKCPQWTRDRPGSQGQPLLVVKTAQEPTHLLKEPVLHRLTYPCPQRGLAHVSPLLASSRSIILIPQRKLRRLQMRYITLISDGLEKEQTSDPGMEGLSRSLTNKESSGERDRVFKGLGFDLHCVQRDSFWMEWNMDYTVSLWTWPRG